MYADECYMCTLFGKSRNSIDAVSDLPRRKSLTKVLATFPFYPVIALILKIESENFHQIIKFKHTHIYIF